MAISALRGLVHRLMGDSGLRDRLRQDPEGVFSQYDLTSEEKASVLSVGAKYGFSASSVALHKAASTDWVASPTP